MPSLSRVSLATWSAIFLLAAIVPVSADVRTPSVFGSHMVLQQGSPVSVWGWADEGEQVTVSFRDQTATAKAGVDGKWSVQLKPLAVGEPGTLKIAGKNTLEFTDVLVGEVWVCSGQSNMQWTVSNSIDADLEIAEASHGKIRLFQVPMVTAAAPQSDVEAKWTLCNPETIPNFSAVAYYFGRNLLQATKTPIGLVQTCWGGTRAEAWVSPKAMAAVGELKPIVTEWQMRDEGYDPVKAKAAYEQELKDWPQRAEKAKASGRAAPPKPVVAGDPRTHRDHPGTLFNAMIAPLAPMTIRGAIWYQGESNAGRAYQYRKLLPTMIQSWRDTFQQGDFPFYVVQLANFRAIVEQPGDSDWAELREAQMLAIDALPNVGVACITDIGAAADIHPKNKQDVGDRLARLALVDNYGFAGKLVRQGPTYKSLDINGAKCIVHFDVGGSPLITYYREPLRGFAIAGADRKWVWAEAKISGKDTVELSHPSVPEPMAVRYNWADNPQGNLYDEQYLPAYPFRSDDWEGMTKGKETPEASR